MKSPHTGTIHTNCLMMCCLPALRDMMRVDSSSHSPSHSDLHSSDLEPKTTGQWSVSRKLMEAYSLTAEE
ncbi:hypothetical protein CesoFtcFv8_026922 [Champsocephalus esox]|uniref:Uncharacterized protein n=1 Tax=Champsocephalus esox TaxID=159716 RepID=A0AAN8B022_9TELE|nr:hypothetical protein CesoFtcFv8_026922 [Champsocephalus esox]